MNITFVTMLSFQQVQQQLYQKVIHNNAAETTTLKFIVLVFVRQTRN